MRTVPGPALARGARPFEGLGLVSELRAARDVARARSTRGSSSGSWWYDARGPPICSPTRDALARAAVHAVAFDDETYWRDPVQYFAKLSAPELPWGGLIA